MCFWQHNCSVSHSLKFFSPPLPRSYRLEQATSRCGAFCRCLCFRSSLLFNLLVAEWCMALWWANAALKDSSNYTLAVSGFITMHSLHPWGAVTDVYFPILFSSSPPATLLLIQRDRSPWQAASLSDPDYNIFKRDSRPRLFFCQSPFSNLKTPLSGFQCGRRLSFGCLQNLHCAKVWVVPRAEGRHPLYCVKKNKLHRSVRAWHDCSGSPSQAVKLVTGRSQMSIKVAFVE